MRLLLGTSVHRVIATLGVGQPLGRGAAGTKIGGHIVQGPDAKVKVLI